jgi:hypothetical protein
VFLRLSEPDRKEARELPGVAPFEPMPGRPMKEYLVFPSDLLSDGSRAKPWIAKSLQYVRGLPPKQKSHRK